MSKFFLIVILSAGMIIALFTGCAGNEQTAASVPTVSVIPESVVSGTSEASGTSTPSFSSSEAESSSTTFEEISEPPIVYDPDVMFVICDKYGKTAPYPDAERSRFYGTMSQVRVAAEVPTDTGYYELKNGDYISAEYLCKPEDIHNFYYERVKGALPTKPPEDIPDYPPETSGEDHEPLIFDRKAALKYAREHWSVDESLCAEFVSECLTAGGLKFDLASSTVLYNTLAASGLGYAVTIDLNEDGFAELPDYVTPGDVVFYYCSAENLMVHTTIYNGNTDDGFMAAFSHNPRSNGEENCAYYKNCPGGCGCPLNKVVAFCFYDF